MTLPFALTGVSDDIVRNPGAARAGLVPTAVDNMSPGHPFIMGLQEIPVVPSVKVNSIIAVEGDGPVDEGDDGVVKYSAAHIAPVESELVVRSGHSVQGNPHAIEEVRRILRLHARPEVTPELARGTTRLESAPMPRGHRRGRRILALLGLTLGGLAYAVATGWGALVLFYLAPGSETCVPPSPGSFSRSGSSPWSRWRCVGPVGRPSARSPLPSCWSLRLAERNALE